MIAPIRKIYKQETWLFNKFHSISHITIIEIQLVFFMYMPVGGSMLSTNMKIAFSALSLILFRITYTNWPTVKSAGTRYLQFVDTRIVRKQACIHM